MHDSRLEDMVRLTLHEEASTMSLSVSVDLLQERLVARRRRARTDRRWLAAAAVAVIAVGGGAAAVSQFRGDSSPIAASPSPSASHSLRLPDATRLLAG
jgi:hypothetical protein